MSVIIGHASKNENGGSRGGQLGDQTGNEVKLLDWYDGGWNAVLRPKSFDIADKSASACEAAGNNPMIGYDQSNRNTLYQYAKDNGFNLGAIKNLCACDCSSLMHVCAIAGGANLGYGTNAVVTSTMVNKFVASGDYELLTGSKYTKSAGSLRRGDILVKSSGHTAMVITTAAVVEESQKAEEENELSNTAIIVITALVLICVSVLFGVGMLFFKE